MQVRSLAKRLNSGGAGSFLLDLYPTLSGYALRRLSASTTNVVRLQRTGGDELDFTPEELEDGTAETWITATGSIATVVILYLQGAGAPNDGNGFISGNLNEIYNSGFNSDNGRKAIGGFLQQTRIYLTTPITSQTLFVVCRQTPNPGRAVQYVIGGVQQGLFTGGTGSGVNGYGYFNNPTFITSTVEDTNQYLLTVDTNANQIRLNGNVEATGSMPALTWSRIGNRSDTTTLNFAGFFQEVIFSNDNQTANVSAIEANINAYYTIY
jgi:hypothetical protein